MTFAQRLPKRGEVYWVSLDPSLGGEITKTRPALVVSNDPSNAALNRVQVVPLTSQTGRVYPSEALITLKGEKRKAMADQLTTASRVRLKEFIGRLSAADIERVEHALVVQLGLPLK